MNNSKITFEFWQGKSQQRIIHFRPYTGPAIKRVGFDYVRKPYWSVKIWGDGPQIPDGFTTDNLISFTRYPTQQTAKQMIKTYFPFQK